MQCRCAGCFVTVQRQASNDHACSMLSTVLFSFSVEKHLAEKNPHWRASVFHLKIADQYSGGMNL